MDSTLLKLIAGSRINGALGMRRRDELVTSESLTYGGHYQWAELPATGLRLPTGELVTKAARNQYVRVEPQESLQVADQYKALVRVNPALMDYGTGPLLYMLDSTDGRVYPGAYLQLRRDLDLGAEDAPKWVTRVSLLA